MVPVPSSDLQQQRVRDAAVDDTRGVHALRQRADAALHLGDHPTAHLPVGHHLPHPGDVDLLHKAPGVIAVGEYPGHVGEQQQLLRAQRGGDLAGRGVGVDVVGLPGLVGGHGRDDRDVAGLDDGAEDGRVDARHLANEAECGGVGGRARGEEARVLAAEADGGGAGDADEGDELLVDLADEHHLHDLHGERVRDAEAVPELRLDADAPQPRVDLRAPAVHEHGAEADAGEEDQVADHRRLQLGRLHRRAAVLHHHRLAPEPLDERERLREHVHAAQRRCRGLGHRRGLRGRHGGGAHAVVAAAATAGSQGRDAARVWARIWERCGGGEEEVGRRVGLGEHHGCALGVRRNA
ncbi:hypothetical protein DAI22_02g274100 [Oryza sativa Japonica Group]|nr:hypothetical protein DAI22_02g274100 [Oryza sativa Japonica Group]